MTRICIITPIVSEGFRDNEPLKSAVPTGCELQHLFLDKGPASVESAVDEVLAGPGVVDMALTAEAGGADAIVIDCMLDPGLHAAREAVHVPVIGCGEAGIRSAAAMGRFSIVTVLQRQEAAFGDLASRYGMKEMLVSVHGIGVPVLDLERDRNGSIAATIDAARRAVAEHGSDAIVFGCTGMLGFAEQTAAALGWGENRVIDPLPNAILVAHRAILKGEKTDKNRYPSPEAKRVTGYEAWPMLSRMMAGCDE